MSKTSAAIGAAVAATQKEVIGAQVVTKTLDTINRYGGKNKKSGGNAMAASYDFNKSVLSAVYEAKGALTNISG
jgi:hypothetical protein